MSKEKPADAEDEFTSLTKKLAACEAEKGELKAALEQTQAQCNALTVAVRAQARLIAG